MTLRNLFRDWNDRHVNMRSDKNAKTASAVCRTTLSQWGDKLSSRRRPTLRFCQTAYSHAGFFSAAALVAATLLTATATFASETVLVKRSVKDKDWKPYTARTVSDLPGFIPPSSTNAIPLDRFGGRADRKAKATGYFRVEKRGDRWWLIDPDGGLFVNVGVVALAPKHNSAFPARFKSDADWEKQTATLLRDNGFNGAGCWSATPLLRTSPHPLVYTVLGDTGLDKAPYGDGFMQAFGKAKKLNRPGVGHADYINDCIPVFHPDFPAFCDTYARPMAALKNDPYLLGYFSDNELPLPQLAKYLALSPDDPSMGSSYKAARDWWDARKGKDAPVSAITKEDEDAWAEYVFGRYFELTTGAIRKYDPNHLCLGSRINLGNRSPGPYRAAGKYLDVVAVNMYFVWDPRERAAQLSGWAGKPILITEFYAKGMDSGFANTSGAGWTVPTQKDRGLFYQTFLLGLLEAKDCVGWHWFKYMDNDPNDTHAEASNRDSNKGIVTNDYTTYPPLLSQMSEVNRSVYALTDYFDHKSVSSAAP